MSEIYYLVRSKTDGHYLAAHPNPDEASGYVLLFREQFDALSYLNTHAGELANRFSVESLVSSQLKGLLKRWSFKGVAIVTDPLLPKVEFLQQQ
ncbi:hypothetical protein G7B40_014675 [Aetokthonos hydrillicola Thurmond2011]|jgi:hypothetical protein|uniref:Uncharacterized protein n=1 Tax=Aetokthonos hydrillicola Thurmond2011 TaxID=2712845 RepID=A0AAP5IB26_9CYAN|nr:hypothetical protein [Aetokthonos hydrillicola]MBO3461406.1 hypothetical protein [Aetokthonos hydrillicola CCALA 1050]MBW4586842.1 hypothetical protein [Aetokthonos hydrillicola CCALA 1050]MDR9895800.1 hypothetical protein [Aetokthonos hydrillicola Thurmond2011]